MKIEICILAGGLSSRMGRDKAGVQLGGAGLLARIKREALKTGWPVRVLRKDSVERCGPIGGVFTALKRSKADAVIFIACDMPFVSAEQLKSVACALTEKSLAVFSKQNGYASFPFAIRNTALGEVHEQIESGDFSLQTLAHNLRARFVRAKKLELFDVDTPEDLAKARHVCGSGLSRQQIRMPKTSRRHAG